MKCMICGGQTLPGAKLCLPCRAALRRARDDTISELLPLPRRREAFAFSHSPDIGSPAPRAGREWRERAGRSRRSPGRWLTTARLHAMAVVAFVAAAGLLTFITVHQLQRERMPANDANTAPAGEAPPIATIPRVSPSTLLGAAREDLNAAPFVAELAEPVEIAPAPSAPAASERKSDRTKARTAVAKAPTVVPASEPAAATEPVTVAAMPAPTISAPAIPTPPDRAQLLAGALAKCSGGFFARAGCEHSARARYCEGQWGQAAQCPAGVANEHGQ